MNIGIDHGYYAIKTRHFSFPAGITAYSHEPYTLQNTLEYGGKFFVCGTGRQPIPSRERAHSAWPESIEVSAPAQSVREKNINAKAWAPKRFIHNKCHLKKRFRVFL